MKEHQKKVLYSTLMASGAGMVLVGAFGLFSPEIYFALFNTGLNENLSINKISKVWAAMYPDKPFDYSFMDEDVARQYESYQRWMRIVGLSTGFAILISCLGLFGLSGINAVNRTKEIGIRKVMGAGLGSIFALMNKQFMALSAIAFVMAIPFSWYVMRQWLGKFEFRTDMDWPLFAASMLGGVLIALLTVSYHSLKAAHTNPAETLKHE